MPKEEWGVKRVSPTTGKRFYDLNRDPIISPYTGEVVTLDTGKGGRSMISSATASKTTKATASDDDEEEVLLEDDVEVIDEGDDSNDSDLGDDVLDEDTVALDDLADVPAEDDDN